MKIYLNSKKRKLDTIIFFISIILFSLFYLIINNNNEKYIFLITLFFLIGTFIIKNRFYLPLEFTSYHFYLIIFCLFCYISAFWAIDKSLAIGKGNTILEILIIMSCLYICLSNNLSIDVFLKVAMWGSYLVVFLSIIYFKPSGIINILKNPQRLDNSFINANSLGMCAGYAILLNFYFILYNKIKIWNIAIILSFIVLIASGSRKAILLILVGTFGIIVLKCMDEKKKYNSLLKIICVIVTFLLIFLLSMRFSAIRYVINRLENMLNAFRGIGEIDNSTSTRLELIKLGIHIFKGHPLYGIGMDNAKTITESIFNKTDYYLHNNYIELLADGGIIGFIMYYWFYVLILLKLIHFKNFKNGYYNICLILFLLFLIMDYGSVSYISKERYFYILILYLQCRNMNISQEKTIKPTRCKKYI